MNIVKIHATKIAKAELNEQVFVFSEILKIKKA